MNISVVIPMYNSQDTIIDALESIKYQTKLSFVKEIIVVNDGSTDESLEILKKYKKSNSKLPITIIDKHNGGVSTARNKGIERAKSKWIALLDSDDEWKRNKLEYQKNIIDNNPQIDFLGGPYNNKKLKILWKKIDYLYQPNVKEICIKNFPQPSTVIFKRKIYDEMGGFDENQRYAEDGNYFVKICNRYNFYYDPKLLITYDGGKRGFGERGLSSNLEEMHKGNLKNIKEFKDLNIIDKKFYMFLKGFYILKYWRRIFLTKFIN